MEKGDHHTRKHDTFSMTTQVVPIAMYMYRKNKVYTVLERPEGAFKYDQEILQSQINPWHREDEVENTISHTTARSSNTLK